MEREDARKLSSDAQHERRRQVVRAFKRGVNRRQIACDVGLSYSSVRMIVNRFKQDGMTGIESGRRGRPAGSCRTLSPEQEEQIQRLICDKRPEHLKLDFALWTRAAVTLLIVNASVVFASRRAVWANISSVGDSRRKSPSAAHMSSCRLRFKSGLIVCVWPLLSKLAGRGLLG